ncbi:glycosyltransferase family 2 protein, partial [Streptococcus pyogenes]
MAQSLSPDEIIVVNDGSNDNGAVIVRENYPQVKVIDQPNQGVSAARNAGINCTKAQFIAFLDADDYWLPNFLKNIVELKTKFPS